MLKNTLIKFLRIFWLFWGCGGIFSPRNSRFYLKFPVIPQSLGALLGNSGITCFIAREQSDRS